MNILKDLSGALQDAVHMNSRQDHATPNMETMYMFQSSFVQARNIHTIRVVTLVRPFQYVHVESCPVSS